jgi:hypothetical protein
MPSRCLLPLPFHPAKWRCSGDLLFGKGGEAVDCVRTSSLVEVLELSWSQLPFGNVGDAGEVVYLDVCNAPDVSSPNLDVVGVDKEKRFLEAHHRRGL